MKIRWYGLNKKFNVVMHSQSMTIEDIMTGNYLSFFALGNRNKEGNCDFLAECLFTGVKDRNGIEIYEGDIIATMYRDKESKLIIKEKGSEVYFENGCFMWEKEPLCFENDNFIVLEKIEWATIIGNIYQNPELSII